MRLECKNPEQVLKVGQNANGAQLPLFGGLRRFRTGSTIRASARGHNVRHPYARHVS